MNSIQDYVQSHIFQKQNKKSPKLQNVQKVVILIWNTANQK